MEKEIRPEFVQALESAMNYITIHAGSEQSMYDHECRVLVYVTGYLKANGYHEIRFSELDMLYKAENKRMKEIEEAVEYAAMLEALTS